MQGIRVTLFALAVIAASPALPQAVVPPTKPSDQAGFASREHPYRLQSGDIVDIAYTYTPDYNQTAIVQPDGSAQLKLVGSVKLEGLTLQEATEQIRSRAAEKLNDPEITLLLKDFVKPHIIISGEVNHPGSFDLHGKTTALDAIALSGGFKDSSKQTQVLLIRRLDGDLAEAHVIDFKALSSKKGFREDITLQPNDLLIVSKNRIGKIEPYIRVTSMALAGMYGVAVLK